MSQWIEVIDGVRYSIRPSFRGDVCPVCGRARKEPLDRRAEGFALAGFKKHQFACFTDALAKEGWREGVYDDDMQRFPVVPLKEA